MEAQLHVVNIKSMLSLFVPKQVKRNWGPSTFDEKDLVALRPQLRKFALKLTKDVDRAEDLVQDTLIRALEKQDKFLEGSNLWSWTSKIMFNLFVSGYRRAKKRETQYDPEPYIMALTEEPNQEHSTDLRRVSRSLARLSTEHQEVIYLVCALGHTYLEVANKLKIPLGTVRSRLSRAKQQLRGDMYDGLLI